MSKNVVSRTEEELLVNKNILNGSLKGSDDVILTPHNTIVTYTGLTNNRDKVIATISKSGNFCGEIYIYFLERNKQGRIISDTFVGQAGYHVLGENKHEILYEYRTDNENNLQANKTNVVQPLVVEKCVISHIGKVQQAYYEAAKQLENASINNNVKVATKTNEITRKK